MRNPEVFFAAVKARVEELNMSTPDVVRASNKRLSTSTVWNILNERVRNIASDTISALAVALKMSEDELFALAYKLPETGDPNEVKLTVLYRNLPVDRKNDLIVIAGALLKAYGSKSAGEIKAEVKIELKTNERKSDVKERKSA